MTSSTISATCWYYDGKVPEARAATLIDTGNDVFLQTEEFKRFYARESLSVSPRVGRAGRFVGLTDGGQCFCTDHAFLDRLPQEFAEEGLVAWLEDHLAVAIGSIVLVAAILLFGYYYVLPAAAQSLLTRIPIETEAQFGRKVLNWFDDNRWMGPSQIAPARRNSLAVSFRRMSEELTLSPRMQLEFRNSTHIGPNAFALPGGIIVMTDQLVELAGSDEEILAILAHEAGHAEKRHAMRQILQGSFVALAVATVTADANTVGAAFTGLPAVLLEKKYSRELEREADEFAFHLLQEHDISPGHFADIMERLEREVGTIRTFSFLSTHPLTEERIEKARTAAGHGSAD